MASKKTSFTLAAISVLPVSHAATVSASPVTGSPIAGVQNVPINLQIIDAGTQSEVLVNGQVVQPYGVGADGQPQYDLFSAVGETVVDGDLYFTDPTTKRVSAMVRFFPTYAQSVTSGGALAFPLLTSSYSFSPYSFATLDGKPDDSPFSTTIYPVGVSAAGGIANMPSVDLNQTFTTQSPGGPAGAYTFTLVPEPASASLLGIGAAILLRRRPRQ